MVEEYVPPRLYNDRACVLLGVDGVSGLHTQSIVEETGLGQIVAVADTGIDRTHRDIPPQRIVGVAALGRKNDVTDPVGHGTHVAGSILGDGSASGGVIRGTAPETNLFFQSILDSNGGLGGLPLQLQDLFDQEYQNGARIHNNSRGARTQGTYTVNAIEVDDFVAQHREMLILIAAGNEGTAAQPKKAQKGFVD
jgi:serine protease AprX